MGTQVSDANSNRREEGDTPFHSCVSCPGMMSRNAPSLPRFQRHRGGPCGELSDHGRFGEHPHAARMCVASEARRDETAPGFFDEQGD